MIAALIIGGVVVLAALLVFGVQGPPYVATDDESAAQMLGLIKSCKPRRILDMGSGDGRLVIFLAKQGYQVDGVELNPWLVLRSRRAIKRAGVADRASVKWANFWTYDVSQYDLVALYVIKHIMPRLEKKLTSELKPGAYIVSNYFVLPNLEAAKQTQRARLYEV